MHSISASIASIELFEWMNEEKQNNKRQRKTKPVWTESIIKSQTSKQMNFKGYFVMRKELYENEHASVRPFAHTRPIIIYAKRFCCL